MPDTSQIAVVIPARLAEETIGACIQGLSEQTLAPELFEVHVVDTGEDGTEGIVAHHSPAWQGRLAYHRADGHGPGRQRNQGVEMTNAGFIAFTDADCVPEPTWLEAGMAHLRNGAAIVQGPVRTPNGSTPPPFAHAIATNGPSPLFESCNVMYNADAFRRAGSFPVDLFDLTGAHLGEDTELAWRVRRSGGSAAYEPEAVVRHAVFPPDYGRHLRYQWQSRFFPRLVRRVPELRGELLTARVFLGRRSLRGCGAIAGLALGRRNPVAYALAIPYLIHIARIGTRAQSPQAAAVGITKHVLADAVREAGLISGSTRYRSLVL